MKHLLVTALALILGFFVGFGVSYTVRQPETAPGLRMNGNPNAAPGEPIVVFMPEGLFSKEEKNELVKNLTQPMIIYNQTAGTPLASLSVAKKTKQSNTIIVTAIQQNGAYLEFTQKIAEQWIPYCFNKTCNNIPEKFRTLYPKIYQAALNK